MNGDVRDWTERDERNAMRFGVCETHPHMPRQLRTSRITSSNGEPVQLLELTCPLCHEPGAKTEK